ncbi:MAG TPA: hypothetical protein VGO86_17910 [Candidatus Dormibacteraeota bacterium]|jgi:hypothetical protein
MIVPAACPRCGQSDSVQRVPGIVASQSSPLSWELRAPQPPGWSGRAARGRGRPGWVWVGLALLLVTLPVDLLVLAAVAVVAFAFAAVIAAVAAVGLAAFGLYRYLNRHVIAERREQRRRDREEALRRYQHALGYWDQLHYCYRCHGVFLPGHPWQHQAVTAAGPLVAPGQAWSLAEELAAYADRVHAPDVLRSGQ